MISKFKKSLLLASFMFLMIFSSLVNNNNVLAAESNNSTTTMKEVTVENTGKNDSYNRIALMSPINSFSEVFVKGDQPGQFTFVDKDNGTVSGPTICEDTRAYPYNLGTLDYYSNSRVTDPWDRVNWLHVDNYEPLDVDDKAMYNISLSSVILGSLDINSPTEFNIAHPNAQTMELYLNIDSEGAYCLYYDDDAINSWPIPIKIISEDNSEIQKFYGDLPEVSTGGGTTIGQYITFFADNPGVYTLIFSANKRHITLNLQKIKTTDNIEYGDRVIYKDVKDEDVNPENLLGSTDGMPIHTYAFDVTAGDYLKYNFALIWGAESSPTIRLALPSPNGYSYDSINEEDENDFTFVPYTGKAYLYIIHENYFSWYASFAITPKRNLLYYKFSIDIIPELLDYKIGTKELIEIDSITERTVITFTLNETSYVYFAAEKIAENPGFNMLDGNPDKTFFTTDEKDGLLNSETILAVNGGCLYRFAPGTYYAEITHPGTTVNSAFLELESKIISVSDTLENKELLKRDESIDDYHDKSEISFTSYEIDSETEEGFEYMPQIFPLTYSNDYKKIFNISSIRGDFPASFVTNDTRFKIHYSFYEISRFNNNTISYLGDDDETLTLYSGNAESDISDKIIVDQIGNYYLSGVGNCFIACWPSNFEFYNGSEYLPYDEDLILRIGTSDRTNCFEQELINSDDINPIESQIQDINYTTDLSYNIVGSFNSSEKYGPLITINNTTNIDWWQFSISLNDSFSPTCFMIYDNVWTDNSGSNTNNIDELFRLNSANSSEERGICVNGSFKFILFAPSGGIFTYKINIARYNISTLYSPEYNKEFKASFIASLPSWALPAGIGGGIAIIVVVGALVIKKKKGI